MSGLAQFQDLLPDAIDVATIPFGEWLPDQPEHSNPGAVEALNVIPSDGCYIPFPQHTPEESGLIPLNETARGATAVILPADVVQIYVGGIHGVYSRIGAAFFDAVVGNPPHSIEHAWQFIRVNEQMVLLHPQRPPVRTPVGTMTLAVLVGGTPPTAACGAQVGDFLVLGNLLVDPDDFGGAFPSRVRWSGFNNIDLPWITDPATQADFQDLPAEGGPVVAISGREVGTIFQARMISRMSYRGPPSIFDIVTVEDKRGALSRDCIVDIGQYKFFIAEDGFFIWNGTNATPIGNAKVNRYFNSRLAYNMRSRIVGAVDFINGCIVWAFPTDSTGTLSELIIYSYREDKWSHSIQTVDYIFNSANSSLTAEDMILPAEDYIYSFDSSFYRGGKLHLAAFNENHTYGLYNGLPMAAVLDTAEFTGPKGHRVFVNSAMPNVDLAVPVATVQVAQRDQMLGQPLVFTNSVAQEITGQCPVLADARYMRFRVNIPAGMQWQHATGIDVSRKATGVV